MRIRIVAAMTAFALLLFPLGAYMLVSHSYELMIAQERDRALSEEAAIARAVTMEVQDSSREMLYSVASSLQRRYGSNTLRVILVNNGLPMAGAILPEIKNIDTLLSTKGRATLLDGDTQTLYIAHRINGEQVLLVASDVSAVYSLRSEMIVWAGALSLAGVLLSSLLSVIISHWLAKPYKELARQRKELIDAMAHEMRTPLTAILGGVRLLERAKLPVEQQQILFSTIGKEAQRLTNMDERLLLLTRMEHQQMNFTLFSSMEMAEEALSVFEGVTLCGEDTQFTAERELTIELMRNLVVNAQRAGGTDAVCVELNRYGFSVKDHGCGMTKEQIAHAFEPFYRADKSRARTAGGAGLGLTLCQRIAKLHGGMLRIESSIGKGTTVTYVMGNLLQH